jgi:feruloyl-CoA hydratase/lyase
MSNVNAEKAVPGGENVKVEFEDGIAWVTLNRPQERNERKR